LTSTFPEVRVVVDAPLQMARSLADLQRQSGSASTGDMEPMLGALQTVAPEIATPSAMEFMAGELRLKVADPSAATLHTLATKLQAHGYTAVQEGDRLVLKLERRP
jgi:general secretion pathway protein L